MFVLIWVTLLFAGTDVKTKSYSNNSLHKEDEAPRSNGSASLIIPNVTVEHSGLYVCTAEHETTTMRAETTVRFCPRILSSSACEAQSDVLTCVCISEGAPLPTIKWPLIDSHSEYSLVSTVSNHTVKSTITMSVQAHSHTTIECVSSNAVGGANMNISIATKKSPQEDVPTTLQIIFDIIKEPQVITVFLIGFLIGIFLSAIVACLARNCSRKKQKRSLNLVENLEMVTTDAAPLMDAGQEAEGDGIYDQPAAEEGAECAGQSAPDGDAIPKEAEYSDIDFSKMKRKTPTGPEETRDTTETEYAEIKKGQMEERQDYGGEDAGVLEGDAAMEVMSGEDKETGQSAMEVMSGGDKETGQCMPAEEEGGEEVALYSNVNDIMGEIEEIKA